MQTEILYRPAFSMARVQLSPNEEIRVEGGAMVSMSSDLTLETRAEGGILKSLARAFFGGESFFINVFKAPEHGGEIMLAPPLPGDMFVMELNNESLMVQSGGFVGCATSIAVDTAWGGAKTFFASEGLIMLKATGTGSLILSSYGAIHEVNLEQGQKFTVDSGHLVAFSEAMGFDVRAVGGLKSTLFSGEGLVVDLTGPGRVLTQTRSVDDLLAWLIPMLPQPSSGGSND